MRALIASLAVFALVGCTGDREGGKKPRGTLSDPVEVCERVADVCRIDRAKLGVCTTTGEGSELICMSQH